MKIEGILPICQEKSNSDEMKTKAACDGGRSTSGANGLSAGKRFHLRSQYGWADSLNLLCNCCCSCKQPEVLRLLRARNICLCGLSPAMDPEAARNARESLELAFHMSNILETELDRHTLSILITLWNPLRLPPEPQIRHQLLEQENVDVHGGKQ
ncbi:hypothetical protein NE237_032424 [Protea cynaroides]|uniref:Uncharacterized protein n=1 Tax=Protea cynaroides TaxID=273540 RepID=A0A9Q0L397_9MAGN|nr:hypothetical protein NE237_032424 [Protea cynaroides]